MARVTEVAKDAVMLTEKRKVTDAKTGEEKWTREKKAIPFGCAIWATGVGAQPL